VTRKLIDFQVLIPRNQLIFGSIDFQVFTVLIEALVGFCKASKNNLGALVGFGRLNESF